MNYINVKERHNVTKLKDTFQICNGFDISIPLSSLSQSASYASSLHPTAASELNRITPTIVADGPMFIPLTMLYTNCLMNPQLPHVESRPYMKFGSASQMLPESSSTNTRSMFELPDEHTGLVK